MADAENSSQDVRRFFDEHQAGARYRNLKALTRLQDAAAASLLNERACGDLLCVGGLWEGFERRPQLGRVTVLDLSEAMMAEDGGGDVERVTGDLFLQNFQPQSFDTIVFSLVLHHVAQGSWRESEHRVVEALARGWRWLANGGQVHVLEYCPHPAWMPLQRRALWATKGFLRLVGQPLVVMHDREFYERNLVLTGFHDLRTDRIAPPGFDEGAWFPVFMATPWLRMPVKLYPKLHLFSARKR